MTSKLAKEERLRIIKRVERGESISKVCSEVGISRVLFYRWYKKYKAEGVRGLNLGEAGRPEMRQRVRKVKEYNILSPNARNLMVKEVIEQKQEAADVAKRYSISRVTLYKWIKRYKTDLSKGYEPDMNSRKPYVERYFRQTPENHEQAVLQIVEQHPEWGIRRIVANLPRVGRTPIVGHHGVQNILGRHNLATLELRLNYARAHITPVTKGISGILEGVSGFFRISPEKRQTFVKTFINLLAGATVLTIVLGVTGLMAHSYSHTTNTSVVGLVFATVALFTGTLFLFYSFKYYFSIATVLSFSQSQGNKVRKGGIGLTSDLSHVKLISKPYISVQIPFYNEKYVVERAMEAATNFDYPEYEVILCDDSTDETTQIIAGYLNANADRVYKKTGEGWELTWGEVKSGVTLKHLHRITRGGYKGGALALALKLTDPRTEYVSIFDADFVPYADTLELFLKYFQVEGYRPEVAAVQGYQWHVLNKSENWITRGVRSEYAGSYVIERSGIEIYGGLKQISGSVYMIKKDILAQIGWGTSITEDFELTLKLYDAGYKVLYTPYIQAPAECVSTLVRLVRQRMRWAEGHSVNVKKMFRKLLGNPHLSVPEKFEFAYLSPYYLQAFFFLFGTTCWLVSETVFRARLPFWTELWGWSLILTNMISLPLLNATGMFMEESGNRDYLGLASFLALSYILVPFQAYASVKGFLEEKEGPWFRTPKTGRITDVFRRGKFYKFISGILPGRNTEPAIEILHGLEADNYLNLTTANNRFDSFRVIPKKNQFIGNLVFICVLTLSCALSFLGSNIKNGSLADLPIQTRVEIAGVGNSFTSQLFKVFSPNKVLAVAGEVQKVALTNTVQIPTDLLTSLLLLVFCVTIGFLIHLYKKKRILFKKAIKVVFVYTIILVWYLTGQPVWQNLTFPLRIKEVYSIGGTGSTLEQSAYRWFRNNNSTSVGSPIVNQDTAMTGSQTPAQGTPFRLRVLIHVSGFNLNANGKDFKLQIATKVGSVCDTNMTTTDESYSDLVATTGAIRYYDNTSATDNAALSADATNDPGHSGHTKITQTYKDLDGSNSNINFTNSQGKISVGEDGEWDFTIVDNSASAGTTYCLRIVPTTGVLNTYTVIPEFTTVPENPLLLFGLYPLMVVLIKKLRRKK